jgi:hypothetical protein
MDIHGFRKITLPNLFDRDGKEYRLAQKASFAPEKTVEPARDSRYPAYAAPLEDGRLVTDYRPQCSRNIPAGSQYRTKLWMVHHADDIIQKSRDRQLEWTGASLPMADTVPPPADIIVTNISSSDITATNIRNGIGLERADAAAPALFGTFTGQPTFEESKANVKNIGLTKMYEGGRNTPRGRQGLILNDVVHSRKL